MIDKRAVHENDGLLCGIGLMAGGVVVGCVAQCTPSCH